MPSILIADDNANIRHLLRSYIETETAFTVCGEAANGAQAVDKARQLNPDIVLLDLAMPQLNGVEAASVLKKALPAVKVVLFTMHVDSLGKSLLSAAGIDFFLSKEQSISKLTDYLKTLLPVDVPALSEGRAAEKTSN